MELLKYATNMDGTQDGLMSIGRAGEQNLESDVVFDYMTTTKTGPYHEGINFAARYPGIMQGSYVQLYHMNSRIALYTDGRVPEFQSASQ